MKTFLFAMCILLILIVVIGINACYVRTVTDRLTEEVSHLPRPDEEGCMDAVASVSALWEEHRHRIGLSVNAHTIEQIDNLIASLRVSARERADTDFEVHRELLIHALRELQPAEKLTFWTVA